MSKPIRLSYTILSAWADGNFDQAIQSYFKLPREVSPAMEAGRRLHGEWEREIRKTDCMPKVFGGAPLSNKAQVEVKRERILGGWLQLVGVLDLLDGDTGYDWKTGTGGVSRHAMGFQHKVYQLLYPNLTRFEYHHLNQYTGEVEMAIVYLNKETLRQGVSWVLTYGSEFKDFIDTNYGEDRPVALEAA